MNTVKNILKGIYFVGQLSEAFAPNFDTKKGNNHLLVSSLALERDVCILQHEVKDGV